MARDASTPVAILHARGFITDEMLDVAIRYSVMYWRHVGKPHPRTSGYFDEAHGAPPIENNSDDERYAILERHFKSMASVLDSCGLEVCRATKALVIDGMWPAALEPIPPFPQSRWDLQSMIKGLAALVDHRLGRRLL